MKICKLQRYVKNGAVHYSPKRARRPYVCRRCGFSYVGVRCPKCGGR